MTEIAEVVAKLEVEVQEKLKEVQALKDLLENFPDLKRKTGRWGKLADYSKLANPLVTDYDQRHNCGCCFDSSLEIWPYLETPQGRVYSDPPCFTVGENSDYGDRPYHNWEDQLRKAGIPEVIVKKIQTYFTSCKEEAFEAVESSFDP